MYMTLLLRPLLIGALALGTVALPSGQVFATDAADSPSASAMPAADLNALYAWHDDTSLYVVVTFNGLTSDADGLYDDTTLYAVHIDTTADGVPNHQVWIRFGQNGAGETGVQVEGLPGTSAPVIGPVDTVLTGDAGTQVWAGPADNPVFVDLAGLQNTLASGHLSFTGADAYAGLNTTAIALTIPLTAVTDGSDVLRVWSTTGAL